MNTGRSERERRAANGIQRAVPELEQARIEVKAFAPLRLNALRGAMADFILRQQHGEIQPETVFAVLVPSCTDRVIHTMQSYSENYAPRLQWVLLDERGHGVRATGRGAVQKLELPFLSFPPLVSSAPPSKLMSPLASPATGSGNLFTPNNQWLLKVMLLSGIDKRYWGGPTVGREFGVGQLAEVAGVPQPSVSRFVTAAEEKGFLVRSGRKLAMQRLPLLLDQWAFHVRNNPDPSLPAVPLYDDVALEDSIVFDGEMIVAGGGTALRALKLSMSNADRPVLYVRNWHSVLDEYDLEECSKEAALCELRKPCAERAVFDGCTVTGGLHVADIVQLYLDARLSAARGEEQAKHIFETVLAPHFREKQWH